MFQNHWPGRARTQASTRALKAVIISTGFVVGIEDCNDVRAASYLDNGHLVTTEDVTAANRFQERLGFVELRRSEGGMSEPDWRSFFSHSASH